MGLDHEFFAKPWRRYLTVAVCVLWGLFELSTGAVGWAMFILGIGGYAQWQFSKVDWSKYDDDGV
ncbi:hypothetical protein KUV51_14075 [Tateyamaria omphalii]|uniref:hypothetical protein n=1 Tax=Tateyamaria omphalii TaxID=299262 RepID=UPI001C998CC0|nr:hypothetical protein [Tateyamaria omphalii]MBY5934132.1 hypothetical protein [Tateyamaria omphalii]